jgi:hypothetical protein
MTYKHEKRFYPYFSPKDGQYKVEVLSYTLWYDEADKLVEIRNESHHIVEKGSDCWDFFTQRKQI